jgi:hypothetical protein
MASRWVRRPPCSQGLRLPCLFMVMATATRHPGREVRVGGVTQDSSTCREGGNAAMLNGGLLLYLMHSQYMMGTTAVSHSCG